MPRKGKYPAPPTETVHPPIRAEQLVHIANDALKRFSGTADELEKALGLLMLGDYLGWKVLIIIHNKRTLRKYEEILGISVREFFPEESQSRCVPLDIASQKNLVTFGKSLAATYQSRTGAS